MRNVEIVGEPRNCGVCGERKTHRVVDGVYTCLICFEAQAENEPEANPPGEATTAEAPEQVVEQPAEGAGFDEGAEKPAEGVGFGSYLCPQCKVTHKAGSKVHKRHLKLL